MHPDKIGNYMALLRKRAKLSQTELAKRAGVSRNCVALIEGGRPNHRNVTIGTLSKIFGALGFAVSVKLVKPIDNDSEGRD